MSERNAMAVSSKEDWAATIVGLALYSILLAGIFLGGDVLGWGVNVRVWTDVTKIFAPASKHYAWMPGIVSLACTYVFLLVITAVIAKFVGYDLKKFTRGFSIILGISIVGLIAGSFAYIAATPNQWKGLHIGWAMGFTVEIGSVILLLVGVALRNGTWFSGIASHLTDETVKPDLFIKIGLVLLYAYLALQVVGAMNLAKTIAIRGSVGVLVVYVVILGLAYLIANKVFGMDWRDALTLAAALSVCGVAAALGVAAVVKPRPAIVGIILSLVVFFSFGELMVLPFAAGQILYKQPIVAGSFMALAVKTDGAAVASGTIAEAAIQAKVRAVSGVGYAPNWILGTTSLMKMEIDIFIVILPFVLALARSRGSKGAPGEKFRFADAWERFPKFLIGCLVAFGTTFVLVTHWPKLIPALKLAASEANGLRLMFFAVAFLSIGLMVKLEDRKKEGIGKVAAAYATNFLLVVIPVAGIASWILFHGVMPPIVR